MTVDPVIGGVVIAIAFVIYLAVHLLRVEEGEKRKASDAVRYETAKETYMRGIYLQYAGKSVPDGYRRANHIDFAGESPLTPARLDEIKREVCK